MRLGLVTYNLARDWDLQTLIARCAETGFQAVELRTTHAHGVEPTLGAAQRAEIRSRFGDSGIRLLSLGTTCEFHSRDASTVRGQIEECAQFAQLASDVGALGVKVRPNGFHADEERSVTLERIGQALGECARIGADHGVEIWLEVHGRGTSEPPHIARILEAADHPNAKACWNSNPTDLDANGSIDSHFELLRPALGNVHINELYRREYPYRHLFQLLSKAGYDRYCLAEIGSTSTDAVTVMKYYRALFDELRRA